MTFLKGWRTRLACAAVFLVELMQVVSPDLIAGVLGSETLPYLRLVYPVMFWGLRQITTTPPGQSK